MANHMVIALDAERGLGRDEVENEKVEGWWTDGATVHVRSDRRIATYRLPTGRPKVIVERFGGGRSRLIVGGFTTITVAVDGPTATIAKLREVVL